jgi:hypothetical protein
MFTRLRKGKQRGGRGSKPESRGSGWSTWGVTTMRSNPQGGRKFGRHRNQEKKMLTTGVGYSGRAALRREQCDVHAVGLMLLGNVHAVGLRVDVS